MARDPRSAYFREQVPPQSSVVIIKNWEKRALRTPSFWGERHETLIPFVLTEWPKGTSFHPLDSSKQTLTISIQASVPFKTDTEMSFTCKDTSLPKSGNNFIPFTSTKSSDFSNGLGANQKFSSLASINFEDFREILAGPILDADLAKSGPFFNAD